MAPSLEETVGCLYQVERMRPYNFNERQPNYGVGNCDSCSPSTDNKNCAYYIPYIIKKEVKTNGSYSSMQ